MVKDDCNFLAFDGPHKAKVVSQIPYVISLHMNDVSSIEVSTGFSFLNTGSPHYVEFRNDIDAMDVLNEGRRIRYNDRFKSEGTNVNFVEPVNGSLSIRTYERGVEDETLSCGTGVTASVIAAADKGIIQSSPGKVITPGGKLLVYYRKDGNQYRDIWLEGQAVRAFSGVYS